MAFITLSVSECTGFETIPSYTNEINIYPNPNNGQFVIKANAKMNVLIFNEMGQSIKTITLEETNNFEVEIENLSKGIYFVIGLSNEAVIRKTVIVGK